MGIQRGRVDPRGLRRGTAGCVRLSVTGKPAKRITSPMCGRRGARGVASVALRSPLTDADVERGGQAWFSTRSSLAAWLCSWSLPA